MNKLKNQFGVVSLLSVTVFSLLLLVIILGMTYILVNVQHQAKDAELSQKAYYAAQAGVEDAVQRIQANLANPANYSQDTCNAKTVNGASAYVCQTITPPASTDTNVVDVANADETNQYEIDGFQGLKAIKVEWNKNSTDSNYLGQDGSHPDAPTNFSDAAANPWTYPAAIELTDAAYTTSEVTSGDGLANKRNGKITGTSLATTVVKPGPSNAGVNKITTAGPNQRNCNTGGTYNCSVIITDFDGILGANANHTIRVRPRFSSTNFRLTFCKDTACSSIITAAFSNKVLIDVTAKAGDVLRRIQTSVKINSSTLSGLDYALFGDTSICKGFTVTVNGSNETANQDGCPLN